MGTAAKGFFSPWGIENLDDTHLPEGTYLTDHLTDLAIDLLEKRDPEQPFFLHFSHYAVHTPIQAPANLIAKYEAKAKRLHLDAIDPIVTGEHFPVLHKRQQRVQRRTLQSHAAYAAMVENLDQNIGRFMEALQAAGLSNDTLVMFTSDNGGLATAEGCPTCNLPLSEGKGWNREGGIRVCQIAHWPGKIPPGVISQTPVISTDFYPTLLEVAQAPLRPEQHQDGLSLTPLFTNPNANFDRDGLFWHYPHYGNQGDTLFCCIISSDGRWKLTEHFEDNKLELFDLVNDISEGVNCASDFPERTHDMHQQLIAWRTEIEAIIPQHNPNWQEPTVPNNAHE